MPFRAIKARARHQHGSRLRKIIKQTGRFREIQGPSLSCGHAAMGSIATLNAYSQKPIDSICPSASGAFVGCTNTMASSVPGKSSIAWQVNATV